MNILTFDTLKFAKRLEEAGFTERQAETLAEEQAAFAEDQAKAVSENLATKADLRDQETRLGARIDAVDTKVSVIGAELAMVKWLVSGIGFGVLLLVLRSFWPV